MIGKLRADSQPLNWHTLSEYSLHIQLPIWHHDTVSTPELWYSRGYRTRSYYARDGCACLWIWIKIRRHWAFNQFSQMQVGENISTLNMPEEASRSRSGMSGTSPVMTWLSPETKYQVKIISKLYKKCYII